MSAVEIVEVAPRDGFQAVGPWIETAAKVAAIQALRAAGFRRMEIGAFVSPGAIAQMADARAIVEATGAAPGLAMLVPNAKGTRLAVQAGVRDIVYVISASPAHNRANVRREIADSVADYREAVSFARDHGVRWRFNVATSWDCPYAGDVAPDAVLRLIDEVLSFLGPAEIGLCDTTGRAFPDKVAALCETAQTRFSSDGLGWAFHGHDTYGLGVANALAAHGAGVRVFDGAAAGMGGCPFAPGASGNTASEDLVFAFENMGHPTGIDLAQLLDAAAQVATIPGAATGGRVRHVPRARVLAAAG
jgi:hydroxymethylglutaryl-CoA lyase